MPDRLVSLLVNFLEQNNGQFSNRANSNEFKALTAEEVVLMRNYTTAFLIYKNESISWFCKESLEKACIC